MAGVTKLLRRLGFVYKKPKIVPGKIEYIHSKYDQKYVSKHTYLLFC
ncbi:hypothetical protein [Candidatus Tisiphia endosymbiont of Dioctria rufipes]